MKRYQLKLLALLIATSSLFLFPVNTRQAQASHATFNKNFLIDDGLFTDTDSMTVAEIQQWLDDNGGSLLANWVDDVHMRRPSDNCVVHHATGMTAAEIIYEAANNWGAQVFNSNGCAVSGAYWSDPGYSNYTLKTVSPKVLLVKLQKEQSLISANGTYSSNSADYQDPTCCSSNEYKLARAMGYGVPDSGSINEKYLGFYNQINWAAWQLRFNYERSAGNTSWDEVGYIQYTGPFIEGSYKACDTCSTIARSGYYTIDGAPLYMDNRATASLYYYTPHTYPGYFGNYNFVQFYTDWFGSTLNPIYSAELYNLMGTKTVKTGSRVLGWVKFRNTGNTTWYDDVGIASAPEGNSATRLVTTKPYMHPSKFGAYWGSGKDILQTTFGKVWGSNGKTVAADQHVVKPGFVVQLNFWISTDDYSLESGNYSQWIRLALEDDTIIEPSVEIKFKLDAPDYEAELIDQDKVDTVTYGEKRLSWVEYRNTGDTNWYDATSIGSATEPYASATRLVTTAPLLRPSKFGNQWGVGKDVANDTFGVVWGSNGITLAADQHVVKPGFIVRIYFWLDPTGTDVSEGINTEKLRLANVDGRIIDPLVNVQVRYEDPNPSAELVKVDSQDSVAVNDRTLSWIRYRNTGNINWYDSTSIGSAPSGYSATRLITTKPVLHTSSFGYEWDASRTIPNDVFGKVFESDGKTLAANQSVVQPGQVVQINFFLSTTEPLTPGIYGQWIRLAEADGTIINPPHEVFVELL